MISGFFEEYRWLSNFWPSLIQYDGLRASTVEHAYQAAKMTTIEHKRLILACTTPGKAKRMARQLPMRVDWDNIKLDIMLELLRLKFAIPELRVKLLRTDDQILVETNHWGDVFWGVCNGVGENNLGKLLMRVREEYHGRT